MTFAVVGSEKHNVYTCLSTDTKNTANSVANDICFETDTSDLYRFDGVTWLKSGSLNAAGELAIAVSAEISNIVAALNIEAEYFDFNIIGSENIPDVWPAGSGVAYSFDAVNLEELSFVNLAFVWDGGTSTVKVDIGWSATGLAADIHTTDADVIVGVLQTGHYRIPAVKDRFMHPIVTQTGTPRDAWMYYGGRNIA